MLRINAFLTHPVMVSNLPPFDTANYWLRKAQIARWQRQQAREQILRSQVGFVEAESSRPSVCQGCKYYHGVSYGYGRVDATSLEPHRQILICGFHPFGWLESSACPDWEAEQV
jgi:hypothetical protein